MPDAVGTWTGLVSSSDDTSIFAGTSACSFEIMQPETDFVLSGITCGETVYPLDADPGPVSGTLYVDDTVDFLVEFDFVENGATYRFASNLGQDEMVGIIVTESAADAPFAAQPAETVAVFVFSRTN